MSLLLIQRTLNQAWLQYIGITLIRGLTLPYYRLYQFNTIRPIKRLAKLTYQTQNSKTILDFLRQWRIRKLAELQFASIAVCLLCKLVPFCIALTTYFESAPCSRLQLSAPSRGQLSGKHTGLRLRSGTAASSSLFSGF